jgi:hypothetical protein
VGKYFSGLAELANCLPRKRGASASIRACSCPAIKNVDRLIRVHPDSQISENSLLFLLRIAMARDLAWAEDKFFVWKNL